MIPRPLHGLIWTAWAVLFGALYFRAFLGSSEPETAPTPVHAPVTEEVALDEPAQPEQEQPPEPEPRPEEPPAPASAAQPRAEPRAELELPVRPAPGEDGAAPSAALPEPELAPPTIEPPTTSSAPPVEALPPSIAPATTSPSEAIAPLEAPPATEPFVETYLMLAAPEGLPALERDHGIVLLARDGEAWFRLRRAEGSPAFEPIQLVELLRTHPGLRYVVPSLDTSGRPTAYRAVLEAFAKVRRMPLERLQLVVALPVARTREIEAARSAARARLQAEGRWAGTLLVHFENGALRFEVR